MSWEPQSYWQVLAGVAAVAALLVLLWNTFVTPRLRRRNLRSPVKAYFHIRELSKGSLPYVVQNDEAHNLKEIVLPTNSVVEIEVAYYPTIPFYVEETVFECEGDYDSKPIVEEPMRPFVVKGDIPQQTNYSNRHGGYHFTSRYGGRAVGSCYTKGFKLRTKLPGVYKTWIGFLTDEIDGDAKDLVIRVEEKPLTRMNCLEHRGCKLRPCRIVS